MDKPQATGKNKSKSGAGNGNGQVSQAADTGSDGIGQGKAVCEKLDWLSFEKKLSQVEHERNEEGRIVKVWHPDGPAMFVGLYASAPVEKGEPKFQWSHGGFEAL